MNAKIRQLGKLGFLVVAMLSFCGVFAAHLALAGEANTKRLQAAIKQIKNGSEERAAADLTALINSKDRTKTELAHALLYRAKAYFAMKRFGLSMADANAALWLGELQDKARDDAISLKERSLASSGAKVAPRPAWAATSTRVRGSSNPVAPKASTTPARAASQPARKARGVATSPPPTRREVQPLKPWSTSAVSKVTTAKQVTGTPAATTGTPAATTRTPAATTVAPRAVPKIPAWSTKAERAQPVPTFGPATVKRVVAKTKPPVAPVAVKPVKPSPPPSIPPFATQTRVAPAPAPSSIPVANSEPTTEPAPSAQQARVQTFTTPLSSAMRPKASAAASESASEAASVPAADAVTVQPGAIEQPVVAATAATLETGSIGAQDDARAESDAARGNDTVPANTDVVGVVTDGLGVHPVMESLFLSTGLQQSSAPTESLLSAAEDAAKRRRERIKRHNEVIAAGGTPRGMPDSDEVAPATSGDVSGDNAAAAQH